MSSFTIPEGPLKSFGFFNFKPNRSTRIATSTLSTSDASMDLMGSVSQVDMAGYATQSARGVYTWQYDIFCGPGDSATSVQDEVTALVNMWHTQNSDGTTGQVALLTVRLLGYATATATGIARLLAIDTAESKSVWKRYHLTFRVPQGFQTP